MWKLMAAGAAVAVAASAWASAQQAPAVERFAVPGEGSVNSWIVDAPDGLVLVDAQRDRVAAERLVAWIRARGRPLVAVLLTHAHPDHIGGLDQIRRAFPGVRVHASPGTAREIATDRMGYQEKTRAIGAAAPRAYPPPDAVFAEGATLRVAGLEVRTREFGAGEASAATAFHLPAQRILFGGDIATTGVEDFLVEGRTGPWLLQVRALRQEYPDTRTVYPGHGAPGPLDRLAASTTRTLATYRRLVAVAGPVAGVLPPDKVRAVAARVRAALGERPAVAAIPNLREENVRAVARELANPRG